jgi:hypothetical protein
MRYIRKVGEPLMGVNPRFFAIHLKIESVDSEQQYPANCLQRTIGFSCGYSPVSPRYIEEAHVITWIHKVQEALSFSLAPQ